MVKVVSLPYIFQVLYVLCFTWTRYQVSVYRTIGPLVLIFAPKDTLWLLVKLNLIEAVLTYTHNLSFEQK